MLILFYCDRLCLYLFDRVVAIKAGNCSISIVEIPSCCLHGYDHDVLSSNSSSFSDFSSINMKDMWRSSSHATTVFYAIINVHHAEAYNQNHLSCVRVESSNFLRPWLSHSQERPQERAWITCWNWKYVVLWVCPKCNQPIKAWCYTCMFT